MSDLATAPNRSLRTIAYGVVALAIVFEMTVVWLMLHPQVPPDYRAYYIDQSTTCLNQPVSGAYAPGTTISFRSGGLEQAKPVRVCGWEGPAGDGTHSVGLTSRLRFALPDPIPGPLSLMLELVAVEKEGHPSQRVAIEVNGTRIETATALAGIPLTVELVISPEIIASAPATLEVALHYADAIRMSPSDSDTRRRAIKLLAARLEPAT